MCIFQHNIFASHFRSAHAHYPLIDFLPPLLGKRKWTDPVVLKANLIAQLFVFTQRRSRAGRRGAELCNGYVFNLHCIFPASCHGSVQQRRSLGATQRAYRSHILLPVGPRQAPGLGRMLSLEGVSLLPCAVDGAQAARRWRNQRRRIWIRTNPAIRVPHAQVRFVRAGAAAGVCPAGRLFKSAAARSGSRRERRAVRERCDGDIFRPGFVCALQSA